MFSRKIFRAVAAVMAGVMLTTTVSVSVARAELVTTDQVIAEVSQEELRARVVGFLQRDDVIQELRELGVDPQEATNRVAALSDRELQIIAGRLAKLPAGEGAVEAVLGAALFIFIVLLITDLLGLTDVFPFVRR